MLVIVEFVLSPGMEAEFEAALAEMQARVEHYDGFLGEEPCRSLNDESKYVTMFRFRDRDTIEAWRLDDEHQRVQRLAREKIFAWYRICVAQVERRYESAR